MLYYERKLKKQGIDLVVGVDEAGRGPLAGPVVAGAVLLKWWRFKNRVDDSKKLSPAAREQAFFEIIGKSVFGIGIVDEKVIDRINILQATQLAMREAVNSLAAKLPASGKSRLHVIVDGRLRLNINFPYTCIIKGDGKSLSIAAASILAKVTRDRIMQLYDRIYPEYKFSQHKGYPTPEHRRIISRIGLSLIHRKSFSYD